MKNKFKFIGSIALAATIGLGALSFAGCTENNVDVYDSKEGYIVLKEADHMYRLHRGSFKKSSYATYFTTSCGYMNTFDYNGAYSYTGERIVNESKGITLSLVDFQLHEHQSTTKGCYDELCEECFPDFNK